MSLLARSAPALVGVAIGGEDAGNILVLNGDDALVAAGWPRRASAKGLIHVENLLGDTDLGDYISGCEQTGRVPWPPMAMEDSPIAESWRTQEWVVKVSLLLPMLI